MTPEERAVIQAAIEWRTAIPGRDQRQVMALQDAAWSLITSCPQCNQGGHTCPGDGNWIAHGETDCGQHDDPHQDAVEAAMAETYGAEQEWLPAAFGDLLAGDRIRIGQQETIVTRTSRPAEWHTANGGRRRWDHVELRMDLEANPGMQQYPPDTACEVLCDAERRAVLLLEQGFPGSSIVS